MPATVPPRLYEQQKRSPSLSFLPAPLSALHLSHSLALPPARRAQARTPLLATEAPPQPLPAPPTDLAASSSKHARTGRLRIPLARPLQQRRRRQHSSISMATAGSRAWGACCWLTIPLLLCSLSIAMAQQENWKQETEETGEQAPEAPIRCIKDCGFFGSSMTNSMCSKCYKDFIKIDNAPSTTAVADNKQAEAAQEQPPTKPPSNRCLTCRKKVGLTVFHCRCGGTFCSTHRYADSHQCTFDYKTAAREQIAKQNPVVMADKINKI